MTKIDVRLPFIDILQRRSLDNSALPIQELDPAVQARIEEAERIAAQAEAEAAAYAEHAANIQAEHDSLQQQHQQVLCLATPFAVAFTVYAVSYAV